MSRPPTVPALSSCGKRFPSVLRSRNSCSYRLPVKPRSGSTVWRGFLFELSGNVNLVGKVGGQLVGKKTGIPGKASQYRKRKRLKSQHGQINNSTHTPKVEGSNPSPAIRAGEQPALFYWGTTCGSDADVIGVYTTVV